MYLNIGISPLQTNSPNIQLFLSAQIFKYSSAKMFGNPQTLVGFSINQHTEILLLLLATQGQNP